DGEQVVRGGVERHSARAAFGGNISHDGKLRRRILVNHGDVAVAGGSECVLRAGIEARGVDALADGFAAEDFTGVGVHHDHELVAAAGEKNVMRGVDGEAARMFAGRDGPAMRDFHGVGIDLHNFAGTFDVGVDVALAVGNGKLRLASEVNGAQHFTRLCIDNGGAL